MDIILQDGQGLEVPEEDEGEPREELGEGTEDVIATLLRGEENVVTLREGD